MTIILFPKITVNNPALSSTFFLTLLLAVGLFFFIRASVKPRTEQVQLKSSLSDESLLGKLNQYFDQRAYKVIAVDKLQNQVKFKGFVRPSLFLAIFLSFLAACGLLCLGFVLSLISSSLTFLVFILPLLSPFAGLFYWKKAGRFEEVVLQIETQQDELQPTLITATGHRDELIELSKFLEA